MLRPLTFNAIINITGFIYTIYLFDFYLSLLFFCVFFSPAFFWINWIILVFALRFTIYISNLLVYLHIILYKSVYGERLLQHSPSISLFLSFVLIHFTITYKSQSLLLLFLFYIIIFTRQEKLENVFLLYLLTLFTISSVLHESVCVLSNLNQKPFHFSLKSFL